MRTKSKKTLTSLRTTSIYNSSNYLAMDFDMSNSLIHYYLAKNLNIFNFLITISY